MSLTDTVFAFVVAGFVIIFVSLFIGCSGGGIVPHTLNSNEMLYSTFEPMSNLTLENDDSGVFISNTRGMDGIYTFPGQNQKLDSFSDNMGDKKKCIKTNMSNQNGFICLTPEQMKMLQTRGGNAE
jgi:hypothetical protein